MENPTNSNRWNVGDEAWNIEHGWGKVVQISGRKVLVRFETFVHKEFDCDDPKLSEIGFSPPLDDDDL